MLLRIFQKKWVILVVLLLPIAIYVLRYDKGQQLSFLDDYNDKRHLNMLPAEVNVSFKLLEHLANKPDTFLHSTKNGYDEQQSFLSTEQTSDKQGNNQQQNSLQLVNQPEKIYKRQSKLQTKRVEQKQSTLLPKDKQDSKQQQNSAIQPVKINQVLVSLSEKDSIFKNYIAKNLSSSQVEDLLQQMGVNNLTSRKAQNQFLQCGGMLTLRRLNGLDPQTSILGIPSHQHCKNMSFKSSGPLVSLSSIPGSGNSWVRQLLEAATGIYTGAIYCDPTYVSDGMIGEFVQTNNVLAVKIHFNIPSATKNLLNNDKSIYIVRSPFGTILAEHTRHILAHSRKKTESHVMEIDFKYGMCIMIIEK